MLPQFVVNLAKSPFVIPHFRALLRPCIFLWLCSITTFAQYRIDHWTTDNGLPQNTVRAIVQTRDGYIWLTTFDGLARFDGVRFTVFDKSNTPAITNNRITSLYEEDDGTLWIGADQGELVTYRNGVFTAHPTSERLRVSAILGLEPDLNDEMLIITGTGAYYLRAGEVFEAPSEYSSKKLKLYRGQTGAQWTIDGRGARQVKDGRAIYYPITLDWNESLQLLQPYEDRQGQLWVGDRSSLYRLRDGKTTRYTEREGAPSRSILRPQCEDNDGGVWFATGYSDITTIGLVRFQDGRFTVYGNAHGLPIIAYNQLIKDREGSIWVATSSGLYRLRRGLVTTYSTANGLLHNEVYPLLKARNGDIWIGTAHGVNVVRNGAVVNHPLSSLKEIVQALWEDAAGRIWIGGYGRLIRYENGKIQSFSVAGPVLDVKSDREGNYWIASYGGLLRLNGDKVVAHYTTKDGLPGDDVKIIYRDRRGVLWLGTFGGLARFEDGKFTNYTAADGLAGNRVRTIYEDAEGTFWIGTYDDGLSRFRDGKFFNYRTEHGLYNNGVFQILEDRRGYFWISCNKGIYRVSRHELNEMAEGRVSRINSVAFGKDDGMLSSECNGGRQPAGLVGDDGRLWFPTMGGVAVIDPEAAQANPQPPPVMIESVTLERDRKDFRQGVTIAPGQRDLEINYTGLSFIKSEQTKFKYRLEGADVDWTDVGTRRVVYYPYLPPGDYVFRVIAANSDGAWNETGASVRITVQAPFWRTWWFALLTLGAAMGVVLIWHRRRIAKVEMKRAEQAKFSQRLIESQELERKRIAAELHDGLGQNLLVIKNRALLGLLPQSDQKHAVEQLNEISTSVSQTLDEVRQIAANLHPYQIDRLGLTKAVEAMIRKVATAAGIKFSTEIENIDECFDAPAQINLYRIVQESLNNIVKHSAASEATVAINRDEQRVAVTIRDNGKGFVTEPATGGLNLGFGLAGMSERARMLGAEYAIRSAPGAGTTITLTMALKEPV